MELAPFRCRSLEFNEINLAGKSLMKRIESNGDKHEPCGISKVEKIYLRDDLLSSAQQIISKPI